MPRDAWQLRERLARHAAQRPDHPAYWIADPGGAARAVTTYGQLTQQVGQLEKRLARRLPDRAAVVLAGVSPPWFPAVFLAAISVGADVAPVPVGTPAAEVARLAHRVGAALVLGDPVLLRAAPLASARKLTLDELLEGPGPDSKNREQALAVPLEEAEAPPQGAAEDARTRGGKLPGARKTSGVDRAGVTSGGGGVLLQSTGTTGLPKTVIRTAASLDRMAQALASGIGLGPDDRTLAVVSMCHSYGLEHGVLAPVWAGATTVITGGMDLPSLTCAIQTRPTHLPGVPALYERLCQRPDIPAGGIRTAYSAGAPLPRAIQEQMQTIFGLRVGQVYGATEIGSVTFADPHAARFDPANAGTPLDGVSIRIAPQDTTAAVAADPTGEVTVHSPFMFEGYLDGPARPDDGFFYTGDLGRMDDAGALHVTGRIKLLIDVGGMKVNPLEVESLLIDHPDVRECVVVPVDQSACVQRIKAVIVPHDTPDGRRINHESIRRFAREHLAGYKVPRTIEIRDHLPRSPTGKILRHHL